MFTCEINDSRNILMTKTIDCLQENYIIEPLYIYPLCATISPLYHNIPFVPLYLLCATIRKQNWNPRYRIFKCDVTHRDEKKRQDRYLRMRIATLCLVTYPPLKLL